MPSTPKISSGEPRGQRGDDPGSSIDRGAGRARKAVFGAEPEGLENWDQIRFPEGVEDKFSLPDTPFGRLGFANFIHQGADTMVTVALANSFFFSLDPSEGRQRVLFGLLFSLAPFAVVAPFIGPLVDRFATSRRLVLVVSAAARAVLCLFLARDLNTAFLFPEAFASLVLAKTTAVANASLVPTVVRREEELVRANSKMSLLAGLAGMIAAPIGAGLAAWSPAAVLVVAALVFVGGAAASMRVVSVPGAISQPQAQPQTKTLTQPQAQGPDHRHDAMAGPTGLRSSGGVEGVTAIRLGAIAVAALRLLVGFITFLMLFRFRIDGAAAWWYAIAIGAFALGAIAGSIVAPQARGVISEERMLAVALTLVTVTGLTAALVASRPMSAVVALLVGVSASAGKLAFDALVQRESDEYRRASSFARFETRFQLSWVVGAIIPVIFEIPFPLGFGLIGMVAALTLVSYIAGDATLARIEAAKSAARRGWRQPVTPNANDWDGEATNPDLR